MPAPTLKRLSIKKITVATVPTKRDSRIRTKCITPNCKNQGMNVGKDKKGETRWRKLCRDCHNEITVKDYAKLHKIKITTIAEMAAHKANYRDSFGNSAVTQHKNSKHVYLQHRKKFCQNTYLDYWDDLADYVHKATGDIRKIIPAEAKGKCTSNILCQAILQVDHKDGNPDHNNEENLHTLCANCHIIKTLIFGDGQTVGRKTLKAAKSKAKI